MSAIGTMELVVATDAIDSNGHVNNVRYVQWMQEAAIFHSAQIGWPQDRFAEMGRTWIVRSHSIEYRHSAYVGETVLVYTWVASFEKIRSLRKFKFYRPADATVLATAATLFLFCDTDSGRPVSIPEEVQQAYQIIPQDKEP